jgi:hypothetical protein
VIPLQSISWHSADSPGNAGTVSRNRTQPIPPNPYLLTIQDHLPTSLGTT